MPACPFACCGGTCVGDAVPPVTTVDRSCLHTRCDEASYCEAPGCCAALQLEGAPRTSEAACAFGLSCVARDLGMVRGAAQARRGVHRPVPRGGHDVQRDQQDLRQARPRRRGVHHERGLLAHLSLRRDPGVQPRPGDRRGVHRRCGVRWRRRVLRRPCRRWRGDVRAAQGNGSACSTNLNCQSQTCDPRAHVCVPEPIVHLRAARLPGSTGALPARGIRSRPSSRWRT